MNEPHTRAIAVPIQKPLDASPHFANEALVETDALFRDAPIPILIEDWSGIKAWVDSLRNSGVDDLDAWLDEHPEVIQKLRELHAFVDANDATLALFDATSKEVFFEWSRQLLPANRFSNSQVLRAMFEGHASCQGERILTTLTGRKVPIVWRCSLPKDIAQYRRLHFYAFDVTEHKENTDRLQALRAQIAHTARVSMVGQLVASITHEIGQPLGAVRTGLDAAVRWLDRSEPNVAEALAAFRHASRWTDDIAGICRRLRGFLTGAPVEAEQLDCAEIVDSSMLLIASEANAHAITLAKEIEPAVTAYADRIQLQQVLTNLLINGIHAIAAVSAEGREPLLTVRARRYNDSQTLFEVVDTGGGIQALQPDAIFQPLSSTKSDGMGMGLPISRSIVEAHGGAIWVADTGASGTRFCFTLPCSARAHGPRSPVAHATRAAANSNGGLL
ncbi:PAS domain-containing sensor histidine kinase [Paraburkholderia phenoliruptrix]|uniref:PAS domain-containing sensor histidine kinase n=1 Tax=Paraburkholderia phenoliruptrix TaxID=252970 RepID=UPI001C6EF6F6|nr:ATP-binding protein [Paraburkholderia phenoliruptrix]MBW9102282.1 histidine kinase [Paraburkholderia phenoliruptrix]MBW9127503.1 histidine kinase [Paraburkholderia ginsengiterrae]